MTSLRKFTKFISFWFLQKGLIGAGAPRYGVPVPRLIISVSFLQPKVCSCGLARFPRGARAGCLT
ncbi:hypothetical protein IWQ49_006239 [Labrenzia sp. EL_126]|nr:hypothetical protein [Labrenzia sp. EL_126]